MLKLLKRQLIEPGPNGVCAYTVRRTRSVRQRRGLITNSALYSSVQEKFPLCRERLVDGSTSTHVKTRNRIMSASRYESYGFTDYYYALSLTCQHETSINSGQHQKRPRIGYVNLTVLQGSLSKVESMYLDELVGKQINFW